MLSPDVGNIIYILDSNSHALIPHQIVEKVTSKTLQGESVHHIIRGPKGRSFRLEDCNHIWFFNLDDAKIHLLEAASKFVELTATKAKQLESVFKFPDQHLRDDETYVDSQSQMHKDNLSVELEESDQ